MDASDRRARPVSGAQQLSPDEIATRAFATGFRGYVEGEVRSFLKRVSEQLAVARERERELTAAVDALEEQLRAPRPLSEQELLDALGEETARLLRSAREAGDDIRKKADERAARITEDAIADAERMRAEAADVLTTRTTEAEARVAEIVAMAEARATEAIATAVAEAEAIVEEARGRGRVMLDEAKAARERVLTDLVRRRVLLQAQVEELRHGREHLVDAFRTVKRTFLEATGALSHVEERAAAERSAALSEPLDIAAEIAAEIEALDALDASAAGDDTASTNGSAGDNDPTAPRVDVDSLFALMRAGSGPPRASEEPHDDAPSPAAHTAAEGGAVTPEEWRETRAREVGPLVPPLVKRAKRVAQDEQNVLLDAVRRHKGRPRAAQVVPDGDAFLARWIEVVREPVGRAYAAGWCAARGAAPEDAPEAADELAREAAGVVAVPLHERLELAIDGHEGDTGGLVERIGARFREWKNQSLERALEEALAFGWSRGVYDAVPDGAVLRWVPSEEGRCSDCDDNALEPTVKGATFPTGQLFPPAHPGCRCLLAPGALLTPPEARVASRMADRSAEG